MAPAPLAPVIEQLNAAGLSPRQIKKALKSASRERPVQGATYLSKLGANYHVAFRALSQGDTAGASARSSSGRAPVGAGTRITVGLILVGLGVFQMKSNLVAVDALRAFNISWGLFFFGGISLVLGFWRWLRD